MRTRRLLLLISAAQLSVGVAGQFVATREGRSFEIFRWHGDPQRVAQESWFMGTGLSAPVAMMAVHAAAIAVLAARPSRGASGTLGALGATMAAGYLMENKFRSALRHPAQEPFVATLGGVGFILAAVMAIIGAREARGAKFPRAA